jgi:hypothetical protein
MSLKNSNDFCTGSSFQTGTKFRLIVDKIVLLTVETPMTAFGLLFGTYFLFNISYPPEAGATLEYVQRGWFTLKKNYLLTS